MTNDKGLILIVCFFISTLNAQELISSQRQAELLYMLRHDCGSCHGMTLKGGLGPSLLPEALADKPPETLAAVILYGRAGTPMPPWRALLTQVEAAWLTEQLRKGIDDAL
ncbi:MAG: cytochrome c [Gammaproteobacteria bacterium]|nr:cytochrome c [Gammaproteobacteria bacterium]